MSASATVIPLAIQRMVCTGCGEEANASCNCGVAYQPKHGRVREAIAATPDKPNKQIARETGADPKQVRRERAKLRGDMSSPKAPAAPDDEQLDAARAVAKAAGKARRAIYSGWHPCDEREKNPAFDAAYKAEVKAVADYNALVDQFNAAAGDAEPEADEPQPAETDPHWILLMKTMAEEAIHLRGDLKSWRESESGFKAPAKLVELVREAADVWTEIADELEAK